MRGGLLPARFRAIRVLGCGAAAEVILAHDLELDREVAVKLLSPRPADATIPARFAREAVIAARVGRHPHVVTVYDTGRWRGRPFLVMQFQPGGSVEDALAEGPIAWERSLRWLQEIGDALDTAHALGVVHRDLKPANILLDERDGAQIADFGIASASGDASLTLTGTILGTAGYLAPEQARGERATAASDRYSLAVVACELLTGRRPPADGLPAPLRVVFDAALAERPEGRPPTAAAFVSALMAAAAPPSPEAATVVVSPPVRAAPTAILRRHRATARARGAGKRVGATVAAGLIAAFALLAFGYVRADTPAAVTCTVSPHDHDANLVVTGVDANAYCAARARALAWAVRPGQKLRSPDLGQRPTLVCRTSRDGLRIEVYDDGRQQIGRDLCGDYAVSKLAVQDA
ncbi:MAG TPA: serine/threonine-protein kinase [Gaiellaceae bacterium]|nr:serine/threonine-protein kinase [Gaiellaceae bacterium]